MDAPHCPRGLIVAAPRSGAGKTTVTLGLLAALRRRGLAVQPFKTGPDYIDTGHHEAAAGRPSFNLDTWAMPSPLIADLVAGASAGADLAVAEGVMGLFDGAGGPGLSGRGSTADLAVLTGWPVVLVLDVSGQTETAAALALGCARYRPDVTIGGVILNRVASERHLDLIRPAFERIGIRLLGSLRRNDKVKAPERHLGLVQANEIADYKQRLGLLAELIEASVDLDAVGELALPLRSTGQGGEAHPAVPPPGQRIALAQDEAFSFTYNHVLRGWRQAGAEILPFSPLANEAPRADADAVWLPGGYPELHADRIAAATHFLDGVRVFAAKGLPVHGECGGYMVLGQGLVDANGQRHGMAGLLRAETSFRERKLHLGYRRAVLRSDCVLGRAGGEVFGHEFHYATLLSDEGDPLLETAGAQARSLGGSRSGSVTGSFFHVLSSVRR